MGGGVITGECVRHFFRCIAPRDFMPGDAYLQGMIFFRKESMSPHPGRSEIWARGTATNPKNCVWKKNPERPSRLV